MTNNSIKELIEAYVEWEGQIHCARHFDDFMQWLKERQEKSEIGGSGNNGGVEKWRPEVGERYWFVCSSGINSIIYHGLFKSELEEVRLGNCYRTKEEAEAKWLEIKKLF